MVPFWFGLAEPFRTVIDFDFDFDCDNFGLHVKLLSSGFALLVNQATFSLFEEPIPPRPMQFHPTQYQPELGQYGPQVVEPEPIPPRPMQFHPTQYQPEPTQYQPQSTQYQPPTPDPNQLLGVIYGSTDTADDYHVHQICNGPQWMD
ncbi:uncharacterized protein F5891DRAFT_1199236 [Suillus fuscotomentosus]|uniref:Uncharacterized protein n=1 Tax=Suillus fuscotomentosus TaxID=1912939 RepID=A0AAD4HDM0_9AGAM|nr:uncharacterized protein F5891DRAFT_1199236 [Suillus fuscotomentosus]KAG1888465.1 hypothetical protein F5891DRAFT_1199236 [Suillus fuscotomentosus]